MSRLLVTLPSGLVVCFQNIELLRFLLPTFIIAIMAICLTIIAKKLLLHVSRNAPLSYPVDCGLGTKFTIRAASEKKNLPGRKKLCMGIDRELIFFVFFFLDSSYKEPLSFTFAETQKINLYVVFKFSLS